MCPKLHFGMWSWDGGKLEESLGSQERAGPGDTPPDRSLTEWTPASLVVYWGPRDVHFLVRSKAQATLCSSPRQSSECRGAAKAGTEGKL